MTRPLMVLLFVAACRTKDLPDTGVTPNESVPVGTDSAGFVDQDGDGVSSETDCDDTDSTVYPGATEVCDGVDDDCDGSVDEEASDASTWYTDADGDGYGDSGLATVSCEPPEGSVTQSGDCDDSDPSYNPGATEGDCQDPNDYNCDGSVGYADNDDDGYPACDDCDDSNNQANPGGSEVCDGADNNCDGSVDEGVTSTYYRDQDADGFGDPDYSSASCEQPSGYVEDSSDCEDTLSAVNPDATEICDLQDNDCDSLIDEDDAADAATWYADTDGDGYGDPGSSQTACSQPSGAVADSTDCDDSDSAVNTGATEICDSIDNDCDGSTDEPDAADASTWYTDSDNDGFGDPSTAQLACEQPSGAVADDQDCDDSARAINPDATEICDSQDNDCDGTIDEPDASDALTWYADADGDGYGDPSSSVLACSQPSGYGTDTQDCDDSDASISPDGLEICDGADNNCDGSTDGSDSWWDSSWAYRIPPPSPPAHTAQKALPSPWRWTSAPPWTA